MQRADVRVGFVAPRMIVLSRRQTSESASLPVCLHVPVVQVSGDPTRAAPMILGAFNSLRRSAAVEAELVDVATAPVVACRVTRQAIFLPTSAEPTL